MRWARAIPPVAKVAAALPGAMAPKKGSEMEFENPQQTLGTIAVDLVIIGGGVAGLSAAINSSAEGLTTVLLEERKRFGGQAGTSTRIENYLGFAEGASGPELTEFAVTQAARLGAHLSTGRRVSQIRPHGRIWKVICDTGHEYVTRAVLICTGQQWRRLEVPGARMCKALVYGPTPEVLARLSGKRVAVVGAANSAGQAALYLAEHNGCQVTILSRRTLGAAMSAYLTDRIGTYPGIRTLEHTEVRAVTDNADGGATLELTSGEMLGVAAALIYIGMVPTPSTFLSGLATTDAEGFLVTAAPEGFALAGARGLFAAGDIVSGTRKRVATATGNAATAIAEIWNYVREVLTAEAEDTAAPRVRA